MSGRDAVLGQRYALGAVVEETSDVVVHEARDLDLGRDVYVRRLRAGDGGRVAAFEDAVRAAARLRHPAIAPVYDAGRDAAGRPFAVTQRTGSESMSFDAGSSRDARVALAARVCGAVAHAHAEGIAFGALGPERVRLGSFGRVQVLPLDALADGAAPRGEEASRADVRALVAMLDASLGSDSGAGSRTLRAALRGAAARAADSSSSPDGLAADLASAADVHRAASLAEARRAEVQARRADAEAADVRRARRHALVLAGAVAVVGAAAAALVAWVGRDADARRRRVEEAADAALAHAAAAHESRDFDAAIASARRALDALRTSGAAESQPSGRAQRAASVLALAIEEREASLLRADRAARHGALLDCLQAAHADAERDPAGAAALVAEALAAAGADVADPARAAEELATSEDGDALLRALFVWETRAASLGVSQRSVSDIVDRLVVRAPDETRARIRRVVDAVRDADPGGALALSKAAPALPSPWLAALGERIRAADAVAGNRYLHEAHVRHPDCAWLHAALAQAYAARPARPADALRHLTAAVALRPDVAALRVRLGWAALACGDTTSAEETLASLERLPAADRPVARAWEAASRAELRLAIAAERGDAAPAAPESDDERALAEDLRDGRHEAARARMLRIVAASPPSADLLRTLNRWRRRPAFAPVRDEAVLGALDPAERQAWTRLWTQVERRVAALGGW